MLNTEETIEHLKECSSFILEKAKRMKDTESEWTVNDLFTFTDIVKDVSEIHKNICKIHKYKSYAQKIIN
jgi:hypothetical protein